MFIYKSNIEVSLSNLIDEIENFTVRTSDQRDYINIKLGMFLQLFDFYRSNYVEIDRILLYKYQEYSEIYLNLRKEIFKWSVKIKS